MCESGPKALPKLNPQAVSLPTLPREPESLPLNCALLDAGPSLNLSCDNADGFAFQGRIVRFSARNSAKSTNEPCSTSSKTHREHLGPAFEWRLPDSGMRAVRKEA